MKTILSAVLVLGLCAVAAAQGEKADPAGTWKCEYSMLTFSVVRKFMDNAIPIDYTLTIDRDKLTGKGSAEFGGQTQEFESPGRGQRRTSSG